MANDFFAGLKRKPLARETQLDHLTQLDRVMISG